MQQNIILKRKIKKIPPTMFNEVRQWKFVILYFMCVIYFFGADIVNTSIGL